MSYIVRDYECLECGEQFEKLVSISDTPTCIECNSNHLRVLPSVAAGYRVNGVNDCSTSPRSHGSFTRRKNGSKGI